jgi:threonine/homoserine/homoserine lactone efflux protein
VIELFVSALLLGFLFNAAPGAVFAETLRRGLKGGFGPAFAVQIGSLAGDLVWAVLGLLGAAALFALPHVGTPLSLAGAALLAWMAWQALRDAFGPVPAADAPGGPLLDRTALAAGAALSLSNPMNVTYWAALGGTVAALGAADPGWAAFSVFLAGFMASSVAWCFLCAGFVAWTRRRLGPWTWRALNLGCGVGLAAFAVVVAARVAAG